MSLSQQEYTYLFNKTVNTCLSLGVNRFQDAEDLAQIILTKSLMKFDDSKSKLSTFLYRSIQWSVREHYRVSSRNKEVLCDDFTRFKFKEQERSLSEPDIKYIKSLKDKLLQEDFNFLLYKFHHKYSNLELANKYNLTVKQASNKYERLILKLRKGNFKNNKTNILKNS